MIIVQNQEITNKSLVTKDLGHISFALGTLILRFLNVSFGYHKGIALITKGDCLVSIIVQKKIWKFRK